MKWLLVNRILVNLDNVASIVIEQDFMKWSVRYSLINELTPTPKIQHIFESKKEAQKELDKIVDFLCDNKEIVLVLE